MIRLAGRFPLLRDGPRYGDDGDERLTIDLRDLAFASPLELAAVASLGSTHAVSRPVQVLTPLHPDVASYLARMDLFAQLEPVARIVGAVPDGLRQSRTESLLEVQPVANNQEGSAVSDWFCRALETRLGPEQTHAPFKMFGELLENAWTHGKSQTGAFAAAQYYSGMSTGRPGLELAICDSGVGVLEHLQRNPKHIDLASSAEALRLAFRRGVSGTRDDRGIGLPEVLRLVSNSDGTSLVFASGDAGVHYRGAGGGVTVVESMLHDEILGTWVWLRVHLSKFAI
jgi:hypothetical protein